MWGAQLRRPGWRMGTCCWLSTGNQWRLWSTTTSSKKLDGVVTKSAYAPCLYQEETFTEGYVPSWWSLQLTLDQNSSQTAFVILQLSISPLLFNDQLSVQDDTKQTVSHSTKSQRGASLRIGGLTYPAMSVGEESDPQVQSSTL